MFWSPSFAWVLLKQVHTCSSRLIKSPDQLLQNTASYTSNQMATRATTASTPTTKNTTTPCSTSRADSITTPACRPTSSMDRLRPSNGDEKIPRRNGSRGGLTRPRKKRGPGATGRTMQRTRGTLRHYVTLLRIHSTEKR